MFVFMVPKIPVPFIFLFSLPGKYWLLPSHVMADSPSPPDRKKGGARGKEDKGKCLLTQHLLPVQTLVETVVSLPLMSQWLDQNSL